MRFRFLAILLCTMLALTNVGEVFAISIPSTELSEESAPETLSAVQVSVPRRSVPNFCELTTPVFTAHQLNCSSISSTSVSASPAGSLYKRLCVFRI